MATQYGPGYDPLDQPGNTGAGLPVIATWSDLSTLEPATVGKEVIVTSVPGASNVRMLARRGAQSWTTPGAQDVVRTYAMNNPIPNNAPTVPKRRRIIGRTSSTQGGVFESGTNDATWWAYAAYSVAGPTRITIDTRITNQTGKDIARIAIPFMGTNANNAQILAVWIGRGGMEHSTTAYQRMTFGGQNTLQLGAGTVFVPSVGVTDTLTLSTPWLDETEILVRIVYENSGQIENYDSFGTGANEDSGLARCWIGIGDAGSTEGALSNADSLTWRNNWSSSIFHVFAEFAEHESPEVSILVYGDSVVNQWKAYQDTLPSIRDGWQFYLEQLNTANTYHVATAGNGGYTVPQYCDRLTAMFSVYAPWIDVVCIEGWTPNGSIQTINELNTWQANITALHSLVTTAGLGWLVLFNSPIGDDKDYPEIGANIHARQLDMIAWCNAQYTGLVIDMRFSLADPEDTDYFLADYSVDSAHYTKSGQIKWATDFKPIIEARLQAYQYSI
jgi:hypothetical protein